MAEADTIPRVLIVGGSGFVGRRLSAELGPRAVPTFRSHPVEGGLRFDALADDPAALLAAHGPFGHAVLGAAETGQDRCAEAPGETRKLNVAAMLRLTEACLAAGTRPIFLSSDAVMDGTTAMNAEDVPLHPTTVYGRQKAEVEQAYRGLGGRVAVARLAKVLGVEPGPANVFSDWLSRLVEGREIPLADDQFLTPIPVDDCARALAAIVERDLAGTYNVAGSERVSRLGLFRLFEAALAEAPELAALERKVRVISIRDLPVREPRPLECSLDNAKLLRDTGLELQTLNEAARRAVAQWRATRQEAGR